MLLSDKDLVFELSMLETMNHITLFEESLCMDVTFHLEILLVTVKTLSKLRTFTCSISWLHFMAFC